MGQLEASEPVVDGSAIPERIDDGDSRDRRLKEKNLAILRAFAGPAANSKPKRVHFVFHAAPVAICGTDRAETVRFERTRLVDGRLAGTGQHQEIRAGLVVFAIGYRASPIPGIAYDEERGLIANVDGRIGNGLYAVGWAKRGPTGVIASNRPDGELCADQICADVPSGTRPGRPALAQLLARRGVRPVTFDDWLRIDAAEVASASEPAPRRKFTSLDEMLAVIAERGRT
jgi:ferredoxin--NADP+ reductase